MGRAYTLNDELRWLDQLAPTAQAELLLRVGQQARLVHLRQEGADGACGFAGALERALNDVMDADAGANAERAGRVLVHLLTHAKALGLSVSAEISELEVDGVLGLSRLPLLSAVIAQPARRS